LADLEHDSKTKIWKIAKILNVIVKSTKSPAQILNGEIS
jgi:hypothetical protein